MLCDSKWSAQSQSVVLSCPWSSLETRFSSESFMSATPMIRMQGDSRSRYISISIFFVKMLWRKFYAKLLWKGKWTRFDFYLSAFVKCADSSDAARPRPDRVRGQASPSPHSAVPQFLLRAWIPFCCSCHGWIHGYFIVRGLPFQSIWKINTRGQGRGSDFWNGR